MSETQNTTRGRPAKAAPHDHTAFRLPSSLLSELREYCSENGHTMTWAVETAITNWLEERKSGKS